MLRSRLGLAPAGAQPMAQGTQVQINTYTTGNQRSPAVAVAPGRRFVVVWHSDGSTGDSTPGS